VSYYISTDSENVRTYADTVAARRALIAKLSEVGVDHGVAVNVVHDAYDLGFARRSAIATDDFSH